ncbi:putative kinase [Stenotrophomonas sp. PvP093]|uniref:zeta toxin family protein n=1 Tax=unclassified Stenotrophomonas TaxID=196198 RepID=UPI001AE7C92E|nr:zeta toxin family protein [Stenotrophomonas sp. PvP093]MBP2480128.1 putative kinase [Stenotrophomonas sp. PvP093]
MTDIPHAQRQELVAFTYEVLSQGVDRSDRPTLSVVVGQSGAPVQPVMYDIAERGRSAGGAMVISAGDMQHITAGYLRGAMPNQELANSMASDVAAMAMAHGRSVVFNPAPGVENGAIPAIQEAKKTGHRVEFSALAVNSALSAAQAWQRSLVDGQAQNGASNRELRGELAVVEKQLRRVEASNMVDAISILDRGGRHIENIHGEATHSATFARQTSQMSGAEKISAAAAWEEVNEGYERAGQSLPDAAEVMRQQAHYQLRADRGASLVFDDRHPEHSHTSKDLAAQHGQRLADLFQRGDAMAAGEFPELTAAFVNQRVAERLGEASGIKLGSQAADRIAANLRDGLPIKEASFEILDREQVQEAVNER